MWKNPNSWSLGCGSRESISKKIFYQSSSTPHVVSWVVSIKINKTKQNKTGKKGNGLLEWERERNCVIFMVISTFHLCCLKLQSDTEKKGNVSQNPSVPVKHVAERAQYLSLKGVICPALPSVCTQNTSGDCIFWKTISGEFCIFHLLKSNFRDELHHLK